MNKSADQPRKPAGRADGGQYDRKPGAGGMDLPPAPPLVIGGYHHRFNDDQTVKNVLQYGDDVQTISMLANRSVDDDTQQQILNTFNTGRYGMNPNGVYHALFVNQTHISPASMNSLRAAVYDGTRPKGVSEATVTRILHNLDARQLLPQDLHERLHKNDPKPVENKPDDKPKQQTATTPKPKSEEDRDERIARIATKAAVNAMTAERHAHSGRYVDDDETRLPNTHSTRSQWPERVGMMLARAATRIRDWWRTLSGIILH